jgi:hypothetical protein
MANAETARDAVAGFAGGETHVGAGGLRRCKAGRAANLKAAPLRGFKTRPRALDNQGPLRYFGANSPTWKINGLGLIRATRRRGRSHRHHAPGSFDGAAFPSVRGRTEVSLIALCQQSEAAAYEMFCHLRWPETGGAPVCPECGSSVASVYRCRRLFKCKAWHLPFSVTSGTLFASRKLPFLVLLVVIGLFINAAKGISSRQASRDLDVHWPSAIRPHAGGPDTGSATARGPGLRPPDGRSAGARPGPHRSRRRAVPAKALRYAHMSIIPYFSMNYSSSPRKRGPRLAGTTLLGALPGVTKVPGGRSHNRAAAYRRAWVPALRCAQPALGPAGGWTRGAGMTTRVPKDVCTASPSSNQPSERRIALARIAFGSKFRANSRIVASTCTRSARNNRS